MRDALFREIEIHALSDLTLYNPINVFFSIYTVHDSDYEKTSRHIDDFKSFTDAKHSLEGLLGGFGNRLRDTVGKELAHLPRVYKTEENHFVLTTWDFETELSHAFDNEEALRPLAMAIMTSKLAERVSR